MFTAILTMLLGLDAYAWKPAVDPAAVATDPGLIVSWT
jgi:hypothetical protein